MYLTLLALPALGSATALLFGRKLGTSGAQIITTTCLFRSAALATIAFYEVGLCDSPVTIHLGTWVDSESLLIK